jgi:replicative DNA helicase
MQSANAKKHLSLNKVTPISESCTPPASPEAEQSVLGAILLRPQVMIDMALLLKPEDFYWQAHRRIFQAMIDLAEKDVPIDLVTLSAQLKDRGQLEGVGGALFLSGLSERVGIAANAEYYARLVRDKAVLRRLLECSQRIASTCLAPQENVGELVGWARQQIDEVFTSANQTEAVSLPHMVEQQSAAVEAQFYDNRRHQGLPTGYLDLAKLIAWEPGDLIVLAARPSMGKTALALNFMLRVSTPGGPHSGIFTLETSKEKLTRRFMSIIGKINGHRMSQGNLTSSEWESVAILQDMVEALPIWIDDSPSLNIAEIRARARRQHKAGVLDFLVVDYLQLIKPLRRGRTREEEVGELSHELKSLAKELHIPVLAISALNRKFADRPNKRPQRSDLRESGAIEFDADKILFLYREEEDKPDEPEVAGIAELIVDKHKDGPIGIVKLAFQKEWFRFEDLGPEPARMTRKFA